MLQVKIDDGDAVRVRMFVRVREDCSGGGRRAFRSPRVARADHRRKAWFTSIYL